MQEKHYENFKNKLDIIKALNKEGLDQEFLDKYEELEYACETLVDQLDDLKTYTFEGELSKVDDFKKDHLLEIYQNVANATEYFKKFYYNEDIRAVYATITKEIDECISSDIKAIAKVTTPETLEEVLANGRKKQIDITGQNVKNIGANLSSRQVIDVGNGQKAVFTPAVKYKKEDAFKNNYNYFADKYPEYKPIFDLAYQQKNIGRLNYFGLPYDENTKTFDLRLFPAIKNTIPSLYNSIIADPMITDLYNQLSRNKDFNEIMYSFLKETAKTFTSYKVNADFLKIGEGDNIDDRNSAMSIVAGLLGVDNLLAHSEPVSITNNGQKIDGTLMNFASGKDLFNLEVDDSMRNASLKKDSVDDEAKRQIANLQVLDFICGNVDRHMGNIFYQFDETNPKKPIFTGIIGIDNDASFCVLPDDKLKKGIMQLPGLDDMNVIDEDMAKKVSGLTPAMLKIALKGLNMNDASIECACKRLTMVQEKLADAIEFDGRNIDTTKLNILKKEDWKKATIIGLSNVLPNSYFSRVKGAVNFVKSVNYMKGDIARERLDIRFKLMQELNPITNQLDQSNVNIASGIKKFRGSSAQYNEIQRLGIALKSASEEIDFDSSKEKLTEFMTKLNESKEKVQAYLDRKYLEAHPTNPKKKAKKFGEYTKHRIDVMNEYLIKLQTKQNSIQKLLDKANELDTLELAVDKKIADQQKLESELAKNKVVDISAPAQNKEVNKEAVVDNTKNK